MRRVSRPRAANSSSRERLADDPVLLAQVGGRVALARARPPGTADVAELHALGERLLEPVSARTPGPHVLRLLLCPDDLFQVRVRRDQLRGLADRERIQLLDPGDGDLSRSLAR